MQFGSKHAAAFKALQGKQPDKTDKDKKKTEKSKQKTDDRRKFAGAGTASQRRDKEEEEGNITIKERGFEDYTLPRKEYKYIVGLIKKDPSIQINQITRKLRGKGFRNHTFNSVVRRKISKFKKIYLEKERQSQDDEFTHD